MRNRKKGQVKGKWSDRLHRVIRLLRHLPQCIRRNSVVSNTGLMIGLLLDTHFRYFKDIIVCWTGFPRPSGLKPWSPWCVLCSYTRPEDVTSQQNVKIRFYISLGRDISVGRALSTEDRRYPQTFCSTGSLLFYEAIETSFRLDSRLSSEVFAPD